MPRVLGFVVITIPLTWFWLALGRDLYGRLFEWVAPPLYELVGLENVFVGSTRLRYINVVPFLGLMLVTPGLTWRRRLGFTALGLVLLFFSHVWLNASDVVIPRQGSLNTPASLLCDVFPFLLWILFTRRSIREARLGRAAPELKEDAPH